MELNITDVHYLELAGLKGQEPKTYHDNTCCNIIVFDSCHYVNLKNIVLGHAPEKGICIGGVGRFKRRIR